MREPNLKNGLHIHMLSMMRRRFGKPDHSDMTSAAEENAKNAKIVNTPLTRAGKRCIFVPIIFQKGALPMKTTRTAAKKLSIVNKTADKFICVGSVFARLKSSGR